MLNKCGFSFIHSLLYTIIVNSNEFILHYAMIPHSFLLI